MKPQVRAGRIKIARESYTWLNAHRHAASDEVARMCAELIAVIENYEVSKYAPDALRRKRRRKDTVKVPDRTRFHQLTEAVLSDLAHHHDVDPGGWLIVSRDTSRLARVSRYKPDYVGKALPHLLDTLAQPDLGYIEQRLGQTVRGTDFGTTTMIRPTALLARRFEKHEANITTTRLRPGEEVIVLRGNVGDEDANPRSWLQYDDTGETRRLRSELRRINDYLEGAERAGALSVDESMLQPGIDPTALRMRRFFTFGSFRTGGRLYHGFWQSLPRVTREKALTIQDESVVTLDFSQAALRIAYGIADADLPPGDGYAIKGLEGHRSGVKKLVNSMLFPRRAHWRQLVPTSIKKKLPNLPEQLLVEAVKDKHPALADYWWTDIGHEIQRIESDIIVHCLLQCIDRDIVALQVHDALIVPKSAEAAVRDIMLETFERHTSIPAEVTAE